MVPKDGSESEPLQLKRAVYAGSFDPPTNGHLSIIEQGAMLFDELEVAIGINPDKRAMFTTPEKLEMLEAITEPFPNVTVSQFENLFLVDYAEEHGFPFIVRGLRSAEDFAVEKIMYSVNHKKRPEIKSVYLMCPRNYDAISSSLVKGLVGPENWEELVAEFVPEFVLNALIKHHSRA